MWAGGSGRTDEAWESKLGFQAGAAGGNCGVTQTLLGASLSFQAAFASSLRPPRST